MHPPGEVEHRAAGLHWLAFLLTECRESSVDIAADTAASQDDGSPYFSTWMMLWSRRVVIAKALATIRDELAVSARRTKLLRVTKPSLPARDWSIDRSTTKVEIENALLAIDVFPRAALLLLVFEGMALDDAAVLLDANPDLVIKARTIALRELTGNLARMQGWKSNTTGSYVVMSELRNA